MTIYVRRGGPNYQEGLRVMREVGQSLRIPIHVFGPETHMTAIVGMALEKKPIPKPSKPSLTTANFLLPSSSYDSNESCETKTRSSSTSGGNQAGGAESTTKSRSMSREIAADYVSVSREDCAVKPLFTDKTKAIVWGMQNKAVQAMLDFDHVCSRKQPSVVAMIYPFT